MFPSKQYYSSIKRSIKIGIKFLVLNVYFFIYISLRLASVLSNGQAINSSL